MVNFSTLGWRWRVSLHLCPRLGKFATLCVESAASVPNPVAPEARKAQRDSALGIRRGVELAMRSGAVAAALAAILSALGASGAEAADMTPVLKGPGSTYIPALYNWTGFYLGVASGWGA